MTGFNVVLIFGSMSNIEDFPPKRGRGRPPIADPMRQIAIRLPAWMLDQLDAINEHERYGQADRASLIREAVAAWIADRRR